MAEDARARLAEELGKRRAWSKNDPTRFAPYKISATGKTSQSLEVVTTATGVELWGRAGIFGTVDGTPPGTAVELSALEEWSKARGLEWLPSSVVYFADKIEHYGDLLYRDGGREDYITPVLDEAQERAEREVAESNTLSEQVVNLIFQ